MRQIILDTETTGLEWKKGNRIVEIGCVELFKRRPTGNNYHQYIKPDCEFEQGAQEVTGLTLEFLDDKPEFAQIADEFLAFIDGAELIIHNAAFDLGFLDNELSLLGPQYGKIADRCTVIDTLAMARERFPPAQLAGCAVQAAGRGQLAPCAAWRPARCADPGRCLYRTDLGSGRDRLRPGR